MHEHSEDQVLTARKPAAKKAPAKKKAVKTAKPKVEKAEPPAVLSHILKSLDDDKAEDIVTIPLHGRSSLADAIVVATGRSSRHVTSIAEHLARAFETDEIDPEVRLRPARGRDRRSR